MSLSVPQPPARHSRAIRSDAFMAGFEGLELRSFGRCTAFYVFGEFQCFYRPGFGPSFDAIMTELRNQFA